MSETPVHVIFTRALAGDPEAREAALDIALRGWAVWMRCAGSIDIGRCMGLPTSATGRRYARMRRDFHLAKAFAAVPGASIPARCESLARMAARFMSDIWPHWRGQESPPFGADTVKANLFLAARALPERMALSGRQLRRIVMTNLVAEMSADSRHHETSSADMEKFMSQFTPRLVDGVHYSTVDASVHEANLAVLVLTTWKSNPTLRASFGDNLNLFAEHVTDEARTRAGLGPDRSIQDVAPASGLVYGVHYRAHFVDTHAIDALAETRWNTSSETRLEFRTKETLRGYLIGEARRLARSYQ